MSGSCPSWRSPLVSDPGPTFGIPQAQSIEARGKAPLHGRTHKPLQPMGHIFLNVHERNRDIS